MLQLMDLVILVVAIALMNVSPNAAIDLVNEQINICDPSGLLFYNGTNNLEHERITTGLKITTIEFNHVIQASIDQLPINFQFSGMNSARENLEHFVRWQILAYRSAQLSRIQ